MKNKIFSTKDYFIFRYTSRTCSTIESDTVCYMVICFWRDTAISNRCLLFKYLLFIFIV